MYCSELPISGVQWSVGDKFSYLEISAQFSSFYLVDVNSNVTFQL